PCAAACAVKVPSPCWFCCGNGPSGPAIADAVSSAAACAGSASTAAIAAVSPAIFSRVAGSSARNESLCQSMLATAFRGSFSVSGATGGASRDAPAATGTACSCLVIVSPPIRWSGVLLSRGHELLIALLGLLVPVSPADLELDGTQVERHARRRLRRRPDGQHRNVARAAAVFRCERLQPPHQSAELPRPLGEPESEQVEERRRDVREPPEEDLELQLRAFGGLA